MKIRVTAVKVNRDGLVELTKPEEHSAIGKVWTVVLWEGGLITQSTDHPGWFCARLSDGHGSWFLSAFKYVLVSSEDERG